MKKKEQKPLSPKDLKAQENLKKAIIQYISSKNYKPTTEAQIFKTLSVGKAQLLAARKILTSFILDGTLEIKEKLFSLKKAAEKPLISGVLRVHQRGFGFVICDNSAENPQDIFIPKQFTNGAVDGDKVEVEIFDNPKSDKGPEGKIIHVVERGREHVAGIVESIVDELFCKAYVPVLGASKLVIVKVVDDYIPKVGDRIILKIESWGSKEKPIEAVFSHYIGHISDPSIDVKAAAEEFDLRSVFPKEVVKEAKSLGIEVPEAEKAKRLDLTKQICCTIDPTSARDYDDALHVSKDRKGNYFLAVHIADVAHYVKKGSALDLEARLRCNSTYFPGKCLPMLPEELSNELCSLKADVLRLTVSVLMHFDKEGTLLKKEIARSIIKSKKRFTYEEAKEVLDGKKSSKHLGMLQKMVELCNLLKQKRRDRGSIDFSLPELYIEVDEKGIPFGTKVIEYDITHQMVEEFMLKANEVVAQELDERGKSLLFRIHEAPSADNSSDFHSLARSLGFTVPSEPTQQDIQKLFGEIKDTPFAQQLTVAFIRSMKLAFYSKENVGHFGLALTHYTHFTSPIRRYSDLIIQRLLFDEEISEKELEDVAQDCSEQERLSFKAESSVKILKKLRLLEFWENQEKYRSYKAFVTKIKPFGFFFELADLGLEGYLHVSELDNDYFVYQEKANKLVGKYKNITYAPSTPIEVEVVHIDFIFQEVKWRLSPNETLAFKGKKKN